MTGRIVNPFQQFLDTLGTDNLAGGTLEFFENGTTTPKAIFTDATLLVPQANPYTLDAAGRVVGDVYLDGLYTVEVRDALGAFVRSTDGVETGGTSSGGGGTSVTNKCINGAMQVALGAALPISASFQVATVSDFALRAVNPSAGTADRELTTNFPDPSPGSSLIARSVTTGTGGTVEYRKRISSADAYDLANATGSFSARVFHNTGVSVNYQVFFNAADALDDFSSVTPIGSSPVMTVNSGVATAVSFSRAMGAQIINGLEIILIASVGAVTSRDYETTEWLMERSSTPSIYDFLLFEEELSRVQAVTPLAQVVDVAPASTPDAIVVENATPITALTDGLIIFARLDHAGNTAAAPTLQVDALATKVIYRENNQTLLTGDTAGAESICVFEYNANIDKFLLINPARQKSINFGTSSVDIPLPNGEINFTIAGTVEMTLGGSALSVPNLNLSVPNGSITGQTVVGTTSVQGGFVISLADFTSQADFLNPTYNFAGLGDSGLGPRSGGGVKLYDGGATVLQVSNSGASFPVPIIMGTGSQILADSSGTVLLPAFAFSTDNNTGFYQPLPGQLAVAIDGVQEIFINTLSATFQIEVIGQSGFHSSTVGAGNTPNYSAAASNTGLFGTASSVGLSVLSTVVAESTTGAWTFGVNVNMGANSFNSSAAITTTGALSGASITALTFINTVNLTATGTVSGLDVAGTTITSDTFRSASDSNDAIIMNGADMSFDIGGIAKMVVGASGVSLPVGGTAAAPDVSFIGETDLGLYRKAAGQMALVTGGIEALVVVDQGVGIVQALFADGSTFRPGISFIDDPDTGFRNAGSGQITVVSNGTLLGDFDSGGWSPTSNKRRSNQERQGVYSGVAGGNPGAIDGPTFPSAWTFARNGVGDYTITHGLGHTNYAVGAESRLGAVDEAYVSAKDATSFRYVRYQAGVGPIDGDFDFMLIAWQ